MFFNINTLPSTLWSVFTADRRCDSTWTTRDEARTQKRDLKELGYTNIRIVRRIVQMAPGSLDLHS